MYWTKDRCIEAAKPFGNKKKFQDAFRGAYTACQRNKWLPEVCAHMEPIGNTLKRMIYAYEFSDNYAYVGLTYNFNQRHNFRMSDPKDQVYKHMAKFGLKPKIIKLTNYVDVKLASSLEHYWEMKYRMEGWNMLNINKTGTNLGTSAKKWDLSLCKQEAAKYNSRSEFKKSSHGAWKAARINGYLDECCIHMVMGCKPNGYWTKERCRQESLKYPDKNGFRKCASAYTYSCRYDWLIEFYPDEKERRPHKYRKTK